MREHPAPKTTVAAGIDVGADWLDVARQLDNGSDGSHDAPEHRRFANAAAGHAALCRWLADAGRPARVAVESSGAYSFDLALALHDAPAVGVMRLNPRGAKDYRRAHIHRSKTDQVDAAVLCDYVRRMPFTAWSPPETAVVESRAVARWIADLTVERARERNRLHAARASKAASAVVVNDIGVNLRHVDRRIDELVRQALKVVGRDARLTEAFGHLTSVRGIASKSAVQLLGELMALPDGMSVREWVAYAGLDVRQHRSGRRVEQRPRTSKVGNVHIRRALFMPAQVAIRFEPEVGAFYERLVDQGKPKVRTVHGPVAVVAVMRKLLHSTYGMLKSIYGMLKHDADFDGTKFYRVQPVGA